RNAWSPPSDATLTKPTTRSSASRATTQPRLWGRIRSHQPASEFPAKESTSSTISASVSGPRHRYVTPSATSSRGTLDEAKTRRIIQLRSSALWATRSSWRSVAGRRRRPDVDLSVDPEDLLQPLGRGSRCLARRQRVRRRGYRAVSYESLEARRCAENQHSRGVAVDAERVRDAHRHHGCRPRHELESLLPGLDRQQPVLHDVALVLRMRVKWRRCVARKQEFDQREAPIRRLT